MNTVKKVTNNDFISISSIMGKPVVGSSTCLSSDFSKANEHIHAFFNAVKTVNVEPEGRVSVKKVYGDIYGIVDDVIVIKFTNHAPIGWMVATSTALPSDIAKAKAYVHAMLEAYTAVTHSINNTKPVELKYKTFINDYSESAFGGMRKVIAGSINNKVAYTAKCFEGKWEFNIVGGLNDDFEWMLAFEEIVKGVNKEVKRLTK